jgi:nitroimidazol reductase NimA-like FMN-containing flavoprotein (pyridoxamine 5'-phosphate oxidase superfamily)
MMTDALITRVEQLLDRVKHACIATVSAEGDPWNTPVFFARYGRSFYWTSRADARHSINVGRNAQVFLVIFDSSREDASGAAVYIEATVTELREPDAVARALDAIYRRRQQSTPPASHFSEPSMHRVYQASIRRAWTNVLHDTDDYPWDERVPIDL